METLGLTLIGAVPLLTMRVFAEERARGTDELLAVDAALAGPDRAGEVRSRPSCS